MAILCHPLDNCKIVYIEIPKAGCTTIKAGLATQRPPFYHFVKERGGFHKRFGYTRLPDVAALYENFATVWKNYFKFAVTRNPYRRFESLFYDKIVGTVSLSINDYVTQRFQKGRWFNDVHAKPQTQLIGADLSKYDFVGRLEAFAETAARLREYGIEFPAAKLNQSKKALNREELSASAIEVLQKVYHQDFQVLGYDLDYQPFC